MATRLQPGNLDVGLEQAVTVRIRGRTPALGPCELELAAELEGLPGVLLRVRDRLKE